MISVVIEHTLLAYKLPYIRGWETQWIGVVGVFIFFVHTSLVLMWSLERKPHTLDFYIRRVFRIYPLAIAIILIAQLLHAPVSNFGPGYFSYHAPPTFHALLADLLMIPNLGHFGYFTVGVMWTLPYEVQMYLVLPVIFFFVRQNFSVWPLLIFLVFTVAVCHALFGQKPHNFFLCIPFFLPGVIAYVGFGRWRAFLPSWLLPVFLLALWMWFMRDPYWRRADYLCLGLGLALPFFHQLKSAAVIRASHVVAKYSYGSYLTHPFAIVLGLYCMPHAPLALQLSVIVVCTVVFSVAAYHLLEHPMIRLGSRLANKAEQRYEQHELATVRIAQATID